MFYTAFNDVWLDLSYERWEGGDVPSRSILPLVCSGCGVAVLVWLHHCTFVALCDPCRERAEGVSKWKGCSPPTCRLTLFMMVGPLRDVLVSYPHTLTPCFATFSATHVRRHVFCVPYVTMLPPSHATRETPRVLFAVNILAEVGLCNGGCGLHDIDQSTTPPDAPASSIKEHLPAALSAATLKAAGLSAPRPGLACSAYRASNVHLKIEDLLIW